MDYLQQIKEEYPDVEPFSGDFEWENQAYSHFKEKNFVKAEEIFKKLCLAEPEHHCGFEGLAYVYYAAGEFEKAEWFMEEALKRANKFKEEGAIDLEVIEEMQESYRCLQLREPLEVAGESFFPGEAAQLYSTNLEAWYKNVYAAPVERRFQMVMEALEQPLPFELLNREDVDFREDIEEQESLQEFFFDYYQELLSKKEMDKCRQLLEKFRSHQPGLYRKDYPYYDRHLIQQALFRGEQERVRDYLDFFIEDPEEGIDQLIVVLQLLQYYGLVELAEVLSRSVYRKVEDSQKIIPGGSQEFADIIFSSTVEKLYYRLQEGERPTLEEVNESLQEYEISADVELFDDILFHLSPGDDSHKIEVLLQNKAGASTGKILSLVLWQFCKYMLEQKGMRFAASAELFSWLVKIFEDTEELREGISADFFALPRERFRDHLLNLGGFLSNQWPKTAALLWSAPYFYDFLLGHKLIEDTCHREALEIIVELKKEFIRGYANRLWEFSFVHTWAAADSVPEEEKAAEKERFAKTFWEVAERKKGRASTAAADADDNPPLSWLGNLSGSNLANLLQFVPQEEKPLLDRERRATLQKNLEKKKHKKKEAKKQRQKQRQRQKKRKK